ncbi:MAG: UDP-glucose 6-dehydrogenase [Cyanobacteria bacterium RYN_339]|nr:UDP-glucose 6-dehydrogenase [Cyanobacteria bacterium RYN_339]
MIVDPFPKRLAVVGASVTALATAGTFARWGHDVVLLDPLDAFDAAVSTGGATSAELGLEALLIEAYRNGRLSFEREPGGWLADVDMVVGACTRMERAFGPALAARLREHASVVLRGDFPPGTLAQLEQAVVSNLGNGVTAGFALNPTVWRPGRACEGALRPYREVVGADGDLDALPLFELFAPQELPIALSTVSSAELVPYAAHGAGHSGVGFLEGLATLCRATGADLHDVALAVGILPEALEPWQAGARTGDGVDLIRLGTSPATTIADALCRRLGQLDRSVIGLYGASPLQATHLLAISSFLQRCGATVRLTPPATSELDSADAVVYLQGPRQALVMAVGEPSLTGSPTVEAGPRFPKATARRDRRHHLFFQGGAQRCAV